MVLRRGASQEKRYLGNEMIQKTSNEGKMKVIVPNETFSLTKLTTFAVSSNVSGFTLASVTSRKILTQGIVSTRRFSALIYICIWNKKPHV